MLTSGLQPGTLPLRRLLHTYFKTSLSLIYCMCSRHIIVDLLWDALKYVPDIASGTLNPPLIHHAMWHFRMIFAFTNITTNITVCQGRLLIFLMWFPALVASPPCPYFSYNTLRTICVSGNFLSGTCFLLTHISLKHNKIFQIQL